MKHPVTIGVIMLARNTFDFEAARGLYADIKKNLAAIPDATFVCADDLVFEVPDLDEPIDKINKANVDGIAIISGTFHLGIWRLRSRNGPMPPCCSGDCPSCLTTEARSASIRSAAST